MKKMTKKKAAKKIHKHGKLGWHAKSIKHSKKERKKVRFHNQWREFGRGLGT